MAWSTPSPPTSGTVITRAWAIANIVNPLLWLRALTGGGDPTAADQALVSDSTTSAAWRPLAEANQLTAAKVSKAGDAMSGDLVFSNSFQGPRLAGGTWLRDDVPGNQFQILANANHTVLYKEDATAVTLEIDHDADVFNFKGQAVYHTGNLPAIGAAVPSGLIAAFPNAAAIASGWVRYTTADGKYLIGAGTSFGQTFVEGASAGSTWDHLHGVNTGTLTTSGGAGGSVQSGGGSTASATGHTHTVSWSGNTANQTVISPSWTIVWAIKS